jgi:hypothetical protein
LPPDGDPMAGISLDVPEWEGVEIGDVDWD